MSAEREARAQLTQPPFVTPTRDSPLRRQCACGNHNVASGQCAHCRRDRLRRNSIGSPRTHVVERAPTTKAWDAVAEAPETPFPQRASERAGNRAGPVDSGSEGSAGTGPFAEIGRAHV